MCSVLSRGNCRALGSWRELKVSIGDWLTHTGRAFALICVNGRDNAGGCVGLVRAWLGLGGVYCGTERRKGRRGRHDDGDVCSWFERASVLCSRG